MFGILKMILVVILISIFCFSQNTAITGIRNFTYNTGKMVYSKATSAMCGSTYGWVASTGNFIK
jgi:hypothetical protein